jgi:hypothetical protein
MSGHDQLQHQQQLQLDHHLECDFSDPLAASASCSSPNGQYIASAQGVKLFIRDIHTLKVVHLFTCIDKIEKFEFSPDSEYILCAMYARTSIQVFCVVPVAADNADAQVVGRTGTSKGAAKDTNKDTNPSTWRCRIDEGVAGLVNAMWCPNSRSILTESDFGIQLAIWSLIDTNDSVIIANPKSNTYKSSSSSTAPVTPLTASTLCQQQLYQFSTCGQYLAVVHRIDLHDHIAVYSVPADADDTSNGGTTGWAELNRFQCRTNDVIHVSWTPAGGTHLVTVDSPLTYAITVYRPSGEIHAQFEAYQHALGVRNICYPRWSTVASPLPLVAVGSYDGKVRLLSARSWQVAFVLPLCHPGQMDASLTHIHSALHSQTLTQIELKEDHSAPTSAWGNIWVETIGGTDDEEVEVHQPTSIGGGRGTSSSSSVLSGRNGGGSAASNAHNKFGGSFSALAAHSMKSSRCANRAPSVFIIKNHLRMLPRVQPDPRSAKMPPLMGAHWAAFCPASGKYLACREESQLRCLWIWSLTDIKLCSLIVLQDNIVSSAWRPQAVQDEGGEAPQESQVPLLAFCTGTSRIYFWTPNEKNQLSCVDIPLPTPALGTSTGIASILITSVSWTSNGRTLILSSRESFVTCDVKLIVESSSEGVTTTTGSPMVTNTVFNLKSINGSGARTNADENAVHN